MSTIVRKVGTADVSVVLRIVDSGDGTPETGVVFNTSGIDLWYRREGEASVDITEATLAALTTGHTDGGFLHINDGWYRLDLPDAACASGVTGVQIGGTVTGMVVLAPYIQLVAYDPFDTVRFGLTALPNAAADAAGGLPISDAGGLDLDAQIGTKINDILTDTGTTLQNELDGIQADTEDIQTRLPAALVGGRIDATVDGTGLEAAAAAVIADAVWEEALADHEGTAGSTAEALADAGGSGASASDIADAVLDEALSGHTTAGTLGKAIADIESDADAILTDTGTTLQNELDGIQADTEDIQGRLPAALVSGRIDASVGAMAADTVTASAIASGAIDADALSAGALDDIWDEAVGDGTITARQALRILIAGMAGKLSGAATTTVTIRNLADSADVVVATVDADGNRSAVTVTP